MLSPDWPENIEMDERGQFSFIPRFYAVYDPLKDQKHKACFDNTPEDEIFISLEKREGHGDLITVGQASVLLPKSIDLKLIDTRFNDRLIGNSHDNVITSSRGNDYLEGKAGRDIYYIEQPEKVGRTLLINNQDTATDPQDDLLVLPVPLSQISDIQVIEQDVVLSSKHEPDQNLSLRFQNFLRHKSYRHIRILDSKGHLFELNVNEQGKAYLDRPESRLYPAEKNEQGQVYFSFSSPPDPAETPEKSDALVIHRRLTGNAQNNVITSSKGNEYLEGKGGRDVYYIKPDHQNKSRTVLINNKDTNTSPGYDLLVLPMRLIEMSDIQAIGKDIVLSSKHEPDKHLKIRFQNFLLDDSYRHINILDSAGDLFELKFDEKGPVYFGAASISPFPTEKADTLVINRYSTQENLDARGVDDLILDNTSSSYTVYGRKGNDIIIALKGGCKTLCGYEGNDQIFSGSDADYLYGGQGDDFLSGGAGDDHLWGDNFLSGGEGKDTYYVSRLDGHTTIEDSDQKYELWLTDIKYNELLLAVINKDIYITLRDPRFKDTFSIKLITKPTTPLSENTYLLTHIKSNNYQYESHSLSRLVKDSICSFSAEEKEQLINRHKNPLLVENMVPLAGY